jgi:colicin import membrane protein
VRGGIRAENYVNAQMLTTVAPETRAAQLLSFDETKAELTSLAKQSERIVQITNKAGRDECHSSLMVLKSRRVDIEKRGKEARDDANKFAKAVIAKEKELIGFIAPEEERLQLLRDQWDTAAEVARLGKLEAERLRVEAIQQKIQQIRDVPGSLVGKPSIIISGQLAELRKTALDEDELGADYLTATDALTAAISRVEQLLAAQQEADAEKKRQAERDAEMEAMRVKMAEQQRLIDEAEEARRVEQERLAQVERDRVAAEEAAARAAEQARIDEAARIEREEQDRIRAEQAEADRIAREAREEASRIEREYEIEQRREAEEKLRIETARVAELEQQAARERKAAAAKAEAERLAGLGLRQAAQAVVDYFTADLHQTLPQCITDLMAALENDAAPARPARTKRVARA